MDAVVINVFTVFCTLHTCIMVIHRAPRASWRFQKVWQSCMWSMMWRALPSYRPMRMTAAFGTASTIWIQSPGLKMPTTQISPEGPWRTANWSDNRHIQAVNGRLWHPDALSFAPQTDFRQKIKLPRTRASYRYPNQRISQDMERLSKTRKQGPWCFCS